MSIQSPSSTALTLLLFFFVRQLSFPFLLDQSLSVSSFVQQIFDFLLSHERTACRPARKSVIALIIALIVTTRQRDQYSTLSHVSIKQLSLEKPKEEGGRELFMINVLLTVDSLLASVLNLIIHN